MDVNEDSTADVMILGLSGKLDATTAKTFEDKILADIEGGERRLAIDRSQLDYVSSSGLRVFLLAAKRLRSRDGKIALCSLKDHVQQVFDLSGFSSILAIYDSRRGDQRRVTFVLSIASPQDRRAPILLEWFRGSLALLRSRGKTSVVLHHSIEFAGDCHRRIKYFNFGNNGTSGITPF
jgi:anti-sigma B factor antagonist